MGVLVIIGLYLVIFFCGIQMAKKTPHAYEKLLIISLTLLLVLQALVNMMVATGLVPTKGLPLPFISYGGTSMVINLAGQHLCAVTITLAPCCKKRIVSLAPARSAGAMASRKRGRLIEKEQFGAVASIHNPTFDALEFGSST
jgi:hypothetical protein